MDLDDLYQEIIFEHYKQPKNQGSLEDADVVIEGRNPFCGDEIKLMLKIKNGLVEDVKFSGSGCAISQSSASVMTEQIKGKSIKEIQELFKDFSIMVRGEDDSHSHIDDTSELAAFQGISAFPTRVKCAMLAWNAMKEGIERELKKHGEDDADS